jgi:hypothetical protein
MPAPSNKKIAEALKQSRGMIAVAARKVGCARKTIYRRLEDSEELQEVLAEARDFTTDVAELKLFSAIEAGEGWAVKYYLSTQGKDRGYVERQQMEHSGPGGMPFPTSIAVTLVRPEDDDSNG